MKNWLVWAGVSFIVGGTVNFAINLSVTKHPSFSEGIYGYAVVWIILGAVLIGIGYIKKKNNTEQ